MLSASLPLSLSLRYSLPLFLCVLHVPPVFYLHSAKGITVLNLDIGYRYCAVFGVRFATIQGATCSLNRASHKTPRSLVRTVISAAP